MFGDEAKQGHFSLSQWVEQNQWAWESHVDDAFDATELGGLTSTAINKLGLVA